MTHRMAQACLEEMVLESYREVSGFPERSRRGRATGLAPLRVCVDVPAATPVLDCRSVSGVVPGVVEVGGRDSTGCTVV